MLPLQECGFNKDYLTKTVQSLGFMVLFNHLCNVPYKTERDFDH